MKFPPAATLPGALSLLLLSGLALSGCGPSASSSNAAGIQTVATTGKFPTYTFEIVKRWPHDPDAFTQGLVFHNGGWLEGTGLNGKSTLRRVEMATGKVLQQVNLPAQFFGEGITVVGSRIFQLTWKDHKGFVYDLESLRFEREFQYEGEGWGLATDGHDLILSDGTAVIRFLDPATGAVKRAIPVTHQGRPVMNLNELEYIKGEIWANVWGSDAIARINPLTGVVTGIVDLTGLLSAAERTPNAEVLNGIAYDAATDRLFLTGKWWPTIFEVKLRLK
jgi:glutamine cyclotransferase